MDHTADVLARHLDYFYKGDIDGILSDYTPATVFFTPRGPLKGLPAIRPFFEAMVAEFAKPGASFQMQQQHIDGDHAYILWSAETADNRYEMGTDTFIIHGGKIIAQSFAGKIVGKPQGGKQ